LVLALGQILREPLQELGALVEGEAAEVRSADRSSMGEHLAHIETAADHLGHDVTRHGAPDVGHV
jgi:hypothetical protein